MPETQISLQRDAGRRFEEAVDFAVEDAMQRRLRYHLLRLTAVALAHEEVPLILALARRAFADEDVADEVSAISDRPGASVLATAIAGIVERSRSRSGQVASPADVLVGAVVGAYTALVDAGSPNRDDAVTAAVLGAVGGGTAVAAGRFIHEQIASVGVADYLSADDRS